MAQSPSEFLKTVEGIIDFLERCEPARLSSKPVQVFIETVIRGLDGLLMSAPEGATEAEVEQLAKRVDKLRSFHFEAA